MDTVFETKTNEAEHNEEADSQIQTGNEPEIVPVQATCMTPNLFKRKGNFKDSSSDTSCLDTPDIRLRKNKQRSKASKSKRSKKDDKQPSISEFTINTAKENDSVTCRYVKQDDGEQPGATDMPDEMSEDDDGNDEDAEDEYEPNDDEDEDDDKFSTDNNEDDSNDRTNDDANQNTELKDILNMVHEIRRTLTTVVKITDLDVKLSPLVRKAELHTTARALKADITHSQSMLFEKLNQKICNLEKENRDLKDEILELKQTTNERFDQIENQRLQDLEQSKLDYADLEQQGRKNTVRIFGVPDHDPKETAYDTMQQVVNVVSSNLDMGLSLADIDIAHRLGKFSKDKPRPIICKLVQRVCKIDIIKNRSKLKGKHMAIVEDLTVVHRDYLDVVQNSERVAAAWSTDGKIFVKYNDRDKVTRLELGSRF